MKTEHTPEPWKSVDSRVYFPKLAGGFSLHNCPDAEANAHRIVACVNWCVGNSTEGMVRAVEIGRPYAVERDSAIARELELIAQRDELLAAAVMAVEMIEYDKHERRHVRWKLNDAIASVKGMK